MRKFFALLLIIFLVAPLAFTTLTLIAVDSWALDRSFYVDLVGDTRIYEVLLENSASVDLVGERVFAAEQLPLDAESQALLAVMTPQYLRDLTVRAVNDAFDIVDGRDYVFDTDLDLVPIKESLRAEGGPRFARALVDNLPACATGQQPVAQGGTLPRCRPAGVSSDDLTRQITQALPAFVQTLPDRMPLGDGPIDLRAQMRRDGVWFPIFPGAQALMIVSIVILALFTVGLWLMAGFLAGYDEHERLLWLGWSLLVPAVGVFLIGLLVNTTFAMGWVRYGLDQATFDGLVNAAAFRDVLVDLSRQAVSVVANGFLMAGGVAGAIALGLIVWGASVAPTHNRRVAALAPAAAQPAVAAPATVAPAPSQPAVDALAPSLVAEEPPAGETQSPQ